MAFHRSMPLDSPPILHPLTVYHRWLMRRPILFVEVYAVFADRAAVVATIHKHTGPHRRVLVWTFNPSRGWCLYGVRPLGQLYGPIPDGEVPEEVLDAAAGSPKVFS